MDTYWAGLSKESWGKITEALEKEGGWESLSLADDIKRFVLPGTHEGVDNLQSDTKGVDKRP